MAEYSTDFVIPKSFNREARDLIDTMLSAGWAFRLSTKGHAIGRAPGDSKTTVSISRGANATNRGLQNGTAAFKRWALDRARGVAPEGMSALSGVEQRERFGGDQPPLPSGIEDIIMRGIAKRIASEDEKDDLKRRAETVYREWLALSEEEGGAEKAKAVTQALREAGLSVEAMVEMMVRNELSEELQKSLMQRAEVIYEEHIEAMAEIEVREREESDMSKKRKSKTLAELDADPKAAFVPAEYARGRAEALAELAADPEATAIPEPRYFTLKPWMAKKAPRKHGGETYASAGVMERTWKNGDVDYVCSIEDCEYSSENPRGVSAHYGAKHTRMGEGTPYAEASKVTVPDMTYLEPEFSRYHPTDRLTVTLAEWLKDKKWDSCEELAVLFLTWAHDRPDLDDVVQSPSRAWTADEIVSRVRMLVGQPLAVRVESLEEEREALREELRQRTVERDEAAADLRRVEQDVDALDALVSGIRRHHAGRADAE